MLTHSLRLASAAVLPLGVLSLLGLGACKDKDKDDDTGSTDTDTVTDTDTDPDTDTDTDTTDTHTDSGTEETGPKYTVIAEGLSDAVFDIWMSDPSNVWVVGADNATDPNGPLVAHYDGSTWTDHEVPMTGKLQWVWSDGGDNVVAVGANAQVAWYTVSTDTWTVTKIGDGRHTLWGVWGPSADDLWAVAGDSFGNANALIYHYDGTAWTIAWTAPDDKFYQAFKVWGSAGDDVWVVGDGGLLVHWDGAAWTQMSVPQGNDVYFTVHGSGPDDAWAVGGAANGKMMHWDGTRWSDETPAFPAIVPVLTGVFDHPQFGTVACGVGGSIWWNDGADAAGWVADAHTPATTQHYHACWVDDDGGVWAVGGNIDGFDLNEGVITYLGTGTVAPM